MMTRAAYGGLPDKDATLGWRAVRPAESELFEC